MSEIVGLKYLCFQHTQLSIKNEKIIAVSMFHEGKESVTILDKFQELGLFQDINKIKYYFVDDILYSIKWRSPNDISGMCTLAGVDWKLRKIENNRGETTFSWCKCLPTIIPQNGSYVPRLDNDGKNFFEVIQDHNATFPCR